MILRILLFTIILLPLTAAHGHGLSDSYLELKVEGRDISGRWLIAVQDLELAVGLDSNLDGNISWGEVRQHRANIDHYALSHMQVFSGASSCDVRLADPLVEERNATVYLHIPLRGNCAEAGPLRLEYSLLFEMDSSHRGVVVVHQEEQVYSLLMSPSNSSVTLSGSAAGGWSHYWTFVAEGVWHIWIGLDHILFLVALLIPIVLKSSSDRGRPERMFIQILQVVTAFTIAHSITLVLATMEWIVLPARLVETLIALSVALSGLNILYPLFRGRHWQIAFGFGLIHGFGFAGVLGDLSLPTQLFVGSLLSFNIGVEIGQLIIVLVLIPPLLIMRKAAWARQQTLVTTGTLITGFGILWVAERYWDLNLISFIPQ